MLTRDGPQQTPIPIYMNKVFDHFGRLRFYQIHQRAVPNGSFHFGCNDMICHFSWYVLLVAFGQAPSSSETETSGPEFERKALGSVPMNERNGYTKPRVNPSSAAISTTSNCGPNNGHIGLTPTPCLNDPLISSAPVLKSFGHDWAVALTVSLTSLLVLVLCNFGKTGICIWRWWTGGEAESWGLMRSVVCFCSIVFGLVTGYVAGIDTLPPLIVTVDGMLPLISGQLWFIRHDLVSGPLLLSISCSQISMVVRFTPCSRVAVHLVAIPDCVVAQPV